jgi:hypothetical protein
MIQIGLVFMFLGEVIRQLGKEESKWEETKWLQ